MSVVRFCLNGPGGIVVLRVKCALPRNFHSHFMLSVVRHARPPPPPKRATPKKRVHEVAVDSDDEGRSRSSSHRAPIRSEPAPAPAPTVDMQVLVSAVRRSVADSVTAAIALKMVAYNNRVICRSVATPTRDGVKVQVRSVSIFEDMYRTKLLSMDFKDVNDIIICLCFLLGIFARETHRDFFSAVAHRTRR